MNNPTRNLRSPAAACLQADLHSATKLQAGGEQADRRADGFDDTELVRDTAADYLAWLGADAARHLRARAEIAAGIGDVISEKAWLDIADAAERLASEPR